MTTKWIKEVFSLMKEYKIEEFKTFFIKIKRNSTDLTNMKMKEEQGFRTKLVEPVNEEEI